MKNMKNILTNNIKLMILITGFASVLVSCEYKDAADSEYPASKLYMPAAVNGIYTINNVPQRVEFLPTQGQAYRFNVDTEKNKFIVPLSVYRGGLDLSTSITANILVNTDTITDLIAVTKIPATALVLPSAEFSVPSSVEIVKDSEIAKFNLEIDLDYLHSFPDAVFAIGIGISSSDLDVNPMLNTTVVVLYTRILNPTANFTANIDASDKAKVTFSNTSAYSVQNLWNFGDEGTATSISPVHFFANSGTYNVTLKAVGVMGSVNQAEITKPVVILLLPLPNYTYAVQAGNSKQINFTNTSAKCVSYSWNFGDGSPVSTESSPSHSYSAAGTYTVVLTGTGDTSATATKSVTITVN